MDARDCLVCDAAREAGRAECKACGQVFEPEIVDPAAPSFYYAAPPVPPAELVPPAKPGRRRFRLFGR